MSYHLTDVGDGEVKDVQVHQGTLVGVISVNSLGLIHITGSPERCRNPEAVRGLIGAIDLGRVLSGALRSARACTA